MFDIISIGGATQDVFVRSEGAQVIRLSDRSHEQAWIGFDYGAKVPVESMRFTVGGGATNTSVGFSLLGLQAACAVRVGDDRSGEQVIAELQAQGVDTRLVCRKPGQTGYSVILTSFEGERSILAYRGANSQLCADDLDWELLAQTRWFYLSSLSGSASELVAPLLAFAREKGIRVAMNPGNTQLKLGLEGLTPLLQDVDLLFLNRDEASALTGISPPRPLPEQRRSGPAHAVRPGYMYDLEPLFEVLCPLVRTAVILTDGKRGTQVAHGDQIYLMPILPVEVADVLGAGDAFGAGFTSGWIAEGDLATALRWGSANSASVVTDPGAHFGLLTRDKMSAFLARFPEIRPFSYPFGRKN